MDYFLFVFIVMFYSIFTVKCENMAISSKNLDQCNVNCPTENGVVKCGFDPELKTYKIFASKCAMKSYAECHHIGYLETPITFCIKKIVKPSRRIYGESCPVFCPSHYRPVCGASKLRSYNYRAFNNACYLDMLNCRGDEDNGYVEVPLHFCQRHLMKNIFKEKVIVSGLVDYKDYNE